MAGFVLFNHHEEDQFVPNTEFHIGNNELDLKIRLMAPHTRVVTLQLDGDELNAALWGLANYRK